ncbi:MAG: guanylate kinase [Candidatus Zapsychrus exili]|nr:guanylate kinase [Candidatus Zapsychrus exili]
MKNNTHVFVLSGPSGSGKTTLYQKLFKSGKLRNKLAKSISVTTRAKRKGEVDGRDYIFVSKKMFEYKKRTEHFVEWQKVFDYYYGTPKKNVRDILKTGKSVLLCIDVKGAKVVFKKLKSAVSIFVRPPSAKELQKRLQKRATDKKKVIDLRLKIAKQEMKEASNYQHIIVNDNFAKCYSKLEGIILDSLNNK